MVTRLEQHTKLGRSSWSVVVQRKEGNLCEIRKNGDAVVAGRKVEKVGRAAALARVNSDWRDLKLRSEVCRDKGEEGCRDMGFTTKKESWRVEELARVGAC